VKAGAKAAKAAEAARATTTKPPTAARSGGKVDAPGKKHRKPAARTRSVKHSNQMISKGKASRQMRRGPPNKG
jgi:hypothetical protein